MFAEVLARPCRTNPETCDNRNRLWSLAIDLRCPVVVLISNLTNGAFGPKKDVATVRIIWTKIRVIKITVFYPAHPNPFHYCL